MYIDSFFYGKTVIAPLGIVLYNVFGKGGPSLYGMNIILAFAVSRYLRLAPLAKSTAVSIVAIVPLENYTVQLSHLLQIKVEAGVMARCLVFLSFLFSSACYMRVTLNLAKRTEMLVNNGGTVLVKHDCHPGRTGRPSAGWEEVKMGTIDGSKSSSRISGKEIPCAVRILDVWWRNTKRVTLDSCSIEFHPQT